MRSLYGERTCIKKKFKKIKKIAKKNLQSKIQENNFNRIL